MTVANRIGSHAQPCRLVWCKRTACRAGRQEPTTACGDCGVSGAVDRRGRCSACAEREQIVAASTPDPDSPPCSYCGGGLDHYPECPEWPGGRR